jgi:hypothetical protein
MLVILSSVTTQYFIAYNGFTTPIYYYWLPRAEWVRIHIPSSFFCFRSERIIVAKFFVFNEGRRTKMGQTRCFVWVRIVGSVFIIELCG